MKESHKEITCKNCRSNKSFQLSCDKLFNFEFKKISFLTISATPSSIQLKNSGVKPLLDGLPAFGLTI